MGCPTVPTLAARPRLGTNCSPRLPPRKQHCSRIFSQAGGRDRTSGTDWDSAWSRLRSEMNSHVDDISSISSPPRFADPPLVQQRDEIRKAEHAALDGWTSSSFHVTGVGVALVMALLMLVTGPPAHL